MTSLSVKPTTFRALDALQNLPWPDVVKPAALDGKTVHAGVLLPVSYGPAGFSVVLTRRSLLVAHHKGEMCFPGGVREEADLDIQSTALREASEEVGIIPHQVKIVGQLQPVLTKTGFKVWPIVGYIPADYGFHVNPDEVSEVIEVPLAAFSPEESSRQEATLEGGLLQKRRSFVYGGRVIHGVTARILCGFMRIVVNELPEEA
jgi:8-oxo-dGTP pyrophosphatase MutT (NUDIX family)